MPEPLPRRRHPCKPCPFRVDAHDRHAYPNLAQYAAGTCGSRGAEMPIGAPMFACHQSKAEPSELCAGWLAVAGYEHLSVRLAIAWGHLPASVLDPGTGWPELFASIGEALASSDASLMETSGSGSGIPELTRASVLRASHVNSEPAPPWREGASRSGPAPDLPARESANG